MIQIHHLLLITTLLAPIAVAAQPAPTPELSAPIVGHQKDFLADPTVAAYIALHRADAAPLLAEMRRCIMLDGGNCMSVRAEIVRRANEAAPPIE